MRVLIDKWRFYGLGKEEYRKCMEKVFTKNITSLRRTNAVAVILLICFFVVPFFINKNSSKAIFFIGTSVIAAFIYVFVRYKFDKISHNIKTSKIIIYILIVLSYINVTSFGIYLGVWANPENIAGTFFSILICSLVLFNIPPVFHHCLIILSIITFIFIVYIVKTPMEYNIDIPNAIFSGIVGIVCGWQIIMNRLSLESLADKMENERNIYYDQTTVDELTQLKNRRDFMNTFQRIIVSPRQSDNYVCIAILDIDFFKSYNDYYGHPEGDECLRKIGKALKNIHDSRNIYAARIGGEEFALVWFEEKAADAQNVASLVCTVIRDLNIPHKKSIIAPYITVSIGIHVVQCGSLDSMNTLYNLADKALYTAKENGRNRAIISSSDPMRITSLCEIM
jgi:diguanylate cyclase (GGDEF)-like protein